MKKLIIMSAIAMSGLMYQTANAQIGVHFNINLGARPVIVERAPVYDADYYYLPEVEAYYSVSQNCYYYQDGGSWVSAAYLPGRYHDFDWRRSNHYAVREARPYLHNDVYRSRYGGIEGRRDWGYRDERSQRVYADRDRFDHNDNRGNYGRGNDNHGNNGGWNNGQQQNDNRGNYGGRNDQRQQPQQNDNRGGYGDRSDRQQAQPQNNDRGGSSNRSNDNNRGGNDNRQGRRGA
jgi:hypothetical protein